jgi:lipid-binding SYLF domain-containing protein
MTKLAKALAALYVAAALFAPVPADTQGRAFAATRGEDLNSDASQALATLMATNPVAADISKQARAVLVFPNIVKAGLIFGGAYGEGVLKQGTQVLGYYNSFSASWGLQAGAQAYGYALFLMNQKAIDYLENSQGWEIGVGPSVVIVNEGAGKNFSSTTLQDDAYAFIFDQKGLMAGVTIEGSKISKIKR